MKNILFKTTIINYTWLNKVYLQACVFCFIFNKYLTVDIWHFTSGLLISGETISYTISMPSHRCSILACTIFYCTPTMYKYKHLSILVCPVGCTVHAKWCTVQPWENTQMGIPFIYTPYVHWTMEAYQKVTPAESDRQIDSQRFQLFVLWKGEEQNVVSSSLSVCVDTFSMFYLRFVVLLFILKIVTVFV